MTDPKSPPKIKLPKGATSNRGQSAKSAPRAEVGYGNPPKHTQFAKGQSGNAAGRPRGSKNKETPWYEEKLQGLLLKEAYREIKINEGERQVSIPMAQAIIRSLAVAAVKGNRRAQQTFLSMVSLTEGKHRNEYEEGLVSLWQYKLHWEREIAKHKRLGLEPPNPIPHPDHIIVDWNNKDSLSIQGPVSQAEKDLLRKARDESKMVLELMQKDWKKKNLDPDFRKELKVGIDEEQKLYEKLCDLVRD